MTPTIVRRDAEIDNALSDLPPILQRIYSARDITDPSQLSRELTELIPFTKMMNIQQAAARLGQALREDQRILIVGDFDADGATSTALAVTALKQFGAERVNFLVPNRFEYGYGLTPEIVDVAKEQFNPDLIITVDNGIASHDGVARATEFKIDVVITDHHLAPSEGVPPACAIVNPNQPGDEFPSKNLAGVGVIFYTMLALRAWLKDHRWFEEQDIECPNMAHLLDLVALGTVADVVPLDKNNRVLVQQGLARIRAGKARPGILALLSVANREHFNIVASDLGFCVGPRLNAAGRLDDMSLGIECLLTEDASDASDFSEQLDALNQQRRALENQMRLEAFSVVDKLNLNKELPEGVCLFNEDWHQGIVGLVASRVKDKVHKPVIAFAKVNELTLKGSARSVKGLHIRDVLDAIATQQPGLITKFGGHSMAAGLSIDIKRFDDFSKAFSEKVDEVLAPEFRQGRCETDGELSAAELTLPTAELLRESGPWGQGFLEPVFDGEFILVEQQLVSEKHMRLMLQHPDSERFIDSIAFNVDLDRWPNYRCERVHLVYRLDVNIYRGRRKLQLMVEQLEPVES